MGFKVIFSHPFKLLIGLSFLAGCQKSELALRKEKNIASSLASVDDLSDRRAFVEQNISFKQLELEWLKLRAKISTAEIHMLEAEKSLVILQHEISRFRDFDKRLPAGKNFISEKNEIEWISKLKVKKEEVQRLSAIVRLYYRDMKGLGAKLSRKGYSSVQQSVFKKADQDL